MNEQSASKRRKAAVEGLYTKITKIEGDGNRFIIHGDGRLKGRLGEVFDRMALGVSVTESDWGADILHTENNRDIVFGVLHERTE